jgi:hypothetical protein
MVVADIIRANLTVARAVLGPVSRLRSGFVHVPLDLRSVDLRLGNVCNLRCRMCSPQSSKALLGEFAAAARLDDGEPWKVSILGDPLTTLGKAGPRVERELPLPGAAGVQEDLTEAVRERDFARAINNLRLLGRDADAAELLDGVLRQDRAALTPDAALAGLGSALFVGDLATLVGAYQVAQPRLGAEEAVRRDGLWSARDMLWHALWPTLRTLNREQAQLLSLNLRTEVLVRDAGEAYDAVAAAVNKEAAGDVVARAARLATGESERRQVEQIGK